MGNTISPSKSITGGQIGKIGELLGAALRKSGLPSEPTQLALKNKTQSPAMVAELVAVVRKYVDAVSNMIVRMVSVNRDRSPHEAIAATNRTQYVDGAVVKSMPRGEGGEAEVSFFNLGRYVSDDELEKEYEIRGLKAADPYSLSAVNEADPSFADEHPNGTHWRDADGRWCFAAFSRWDGERGVLVDRYGDEWSGDWWFAGVRK